MNHRTFDRRRLLRGAGGVVLGLPALEAFAPRRASAAGKTIYTIFMAQANGAIQGTGGDPDMFWPRATGPLSAATMAGADADRATSELKDHAAKLVMIKGIGFPFGNPVGCGHSAGCNQMLTASRPSGSENRSLPGGESIDVRMARALAPDPARVDPLTLFAGWKQGYLDDAMSYRAGGAVRAGRDNPWDAYQSMTGLDTVGKSDPGLLQKLAARRKSVNDLLRTEINDLRGRRELSKSDRERLDLHFTSVRDLEVGMTNMMGPMPAGGTLAGDLQALNGMYQANDKMEEVVKLHLSLAAFALASDRFRVATVQIGEGNDHTQYFINGVKAPPYHFISHRVLSDGDGGTKIGNAVDLHAAIDRIHARMFKHLLDQLTMYRTADGRPLLDDCTAVWLNSNGNGPPHDVGNVPHIIAGSAGGFWKTGQHVNLKVQNNKFLNSVATAAGVKNAAGGPLDDFGDAGLAKGLISEIIA
jgi:hypothetical protein